MKKKLLFIDDEIQLLKIWEKYFFAEHFDVLTAPSGKEGLKRAHKDKPDLIVLDYKMPIMNGLETLKRLRKEDPHTKVIILSGYGYPAAISEAAELGIAEFVAKPLDLKHLLHIIQEILR